MPKKIEVMSRQQLLDNCDVNENGCWIWRHSTRGQMGYAQVNGTAVGRRQVGGHQLAYFFKTGYLPTVGMHTCDTPRCCNPRHIKNGDCSDNNRDAWAKGHREEDREQKRQRMKEDKNGHYSRGRELGMSRGLAVMNGKS